MSPGWSQNSVPWMPTTSSLVPRNIKSHHTAGSRLPLPSFLLALCSPVPWPPKNCSLLLSSNWSRESRVIPQLRGELSSWFFHVTFSSEFITGETRKSQLYFCSGKQFTLDQILFCWKKFFCCLAIYQTFILKYYQFLENFQATRTPEIFLYYQLGNT